MEDYLIEYEADWMPRLTKYQRRVNSMKIASERLHETMSFFARGKNESADIRFQFFGWDKCISESLELEEAKQLLDVLKDAIIDCERRKLIKDDEE
jgi:hypothetical protein